MAWSAFTEEYALAAVSGDLDLSGGTLMATFADSSFVGWFVFLTLCLHYTAAIGSARARRLPIVTLAAAVGYQVFVLLRSDPLAEPFEGMVSPLAVPAIAGPARIISAVLAIVVGLCLLASVYELFSAFRRSRGEARQQLLWLVAGAAPLGPAVVAAFAVSYAGYESAALPILAFCIVTLVAGRRPVRGQVSAVRRGAGRHRLLGVRPVHRRGDRRLRAGRPGDHPHRAGRRRLSAVDGAGHPGRGGRRAAGVRLGPQPGRPPLQPAPLRRGAGRRERAGRAALRISRSCCAPRSATPRARGVPRGRELGHVPTAGTRSPASTPWTSSDAAR